MEKDNRHFPHQQREHGPLASTLSSSRRYLSTTNAEQVQGFTDCLTVIETAAELRSFGNLRIRNAFSQSERDAAKKRFRDIFEKVNDPANKPDYIEGKHKAAQFSKYLATIHRHGKNNVEADIFAVKQLREVLREFSPETISGKQ